MSDTSTNPAEPTENQGGGTASTVTTDTTVDNNPDEVTAEPTENQGGGSA
jgi:hypothetical protein